MNIIQQSETKLIIKEDTKILGLIILIIGVFASCLIIFFVHNIYGNTKSFMQVTIGIASILFILVLIYFYNVYKTILVSFDKDSELFIISTSTIFSKKQVEYPLKTVTEIVSRPITVYNGAWGLQGVVWNKLYGNQNLFGYTNPLVGIFGEIVIVFKDSKEYILKPNAYTLFLTNPNNLNEKERVVAEKIAKFLDVPLSQKELQKPLVQF